MNCWWDGHGAEEVDTPRGSAVQGVTTLAGCKAACVASDDDGSSSAWPVARRAMAANKPFCDGVLFNMNTGQCYRKASVDVSRCPSDGQFSLYLRTEANRPPAAPRPDPSDKMLTAEKCSRFMRDPDHKFYSIWGERGWKWRRHGDRGCYGDGNWFDWVAGGNNCNQKWGANLNAPTVFGFAETMEAFCNEKAGRGWTFSARDPTWACNNAGYNVLRTGGWK